MARGKVRTYSDEKLINLLAQGDYTYTQIGRAVGLSKAQVGKIARGERRKDLQTRIRAARRAFLEQAERLGIQWARPLLMRHIQVGLRGLGETARKCREFALDRCAFHRDKPRVRRT